MRALLAACGQTAPATFPATFDGASQPAFDAKRQLGEGGEEKAVTGEKNQ